jgi:hypothetical protein
MTERGAVDSAAASSVSLNMADGTVSLANLHLEEVTFRFELKRRQKARGPEKKKTQNKTLPQLRSSQSRAEKRKAEDDFNPIQYFEIRSRTITKPKEALTRIHTRTSS